MLFYTVEFLIFSLILLGTLAIVHRNEPRKIVLLLASYVFYMWWNPVFIVLIIFATFFNYGAARLIENEADPRRRRSVLIVGLVGSLGLLGYFKYAGFLADSDPPAQPNGVNPGEFLTIIFNLINGQTFADVINELDTADELRIGIHVQGFANGGSESFVNVPAPGALGVSALAGLVALRRRRR